MAGADIGIDTAGNIRVANGKIVIVTKREAVKQRVRQALLQLLGEWFRDRFEGTDYLGQILTRPFRPSTADREVRRIVVNCKGVQSILLVTVTEQTTTQKATIRVKFRDIYGSQTDVEVAQ